MGDEMTLKQFVESTYFKGIARLCMIIVIPAIISVGTFLLGLMGDVGALKESQVTRAGDNERFQASITSDVSEVKEGVATVQSDVGGIKLEMAKMSGILEEMQRQDRDVAARFVTRDPLP